MDILQYVDPDVFEIKYYDEDSWLEERRKGMGGSDVAVVMGLSKYKSELKLYKEKVEGLREDLSENVFVKKGKDLEDLIRIKYCTPYFEGLGYTLTHPDTILCNTKYPIFRANLDAYAVSQTFAEDYTKNIVVEIKWVSEFGEANWDGDDYCGVPANYYAQVQEYMFVTGARKAIICAMFDSDWTVRFYEIPYNPDFVANMVKETTRFMKCHVELKIPPRINSELDKEFIASAIASMETDEIPNDTMNEKIVQYKELKSNIKTLEQGANAILSELTQLYLNGNRPTSPVCHMKISRVYAKRFDTTAFQTDHPDLYNQYTKSSEYSRTTIK